MPEVILRDGCERKLGHGVITTALIDALYHCNSDGDGLIEVATLPARVHGHVCKLADGAKSVPPSPSGVLATGTVRR